MDAAERVLGVRAGSAIEDKTEVQAENFRPLVHEGRYALGLEDAR